MLKAYQVSDKDYYNGSTIVWAENPNKAKLEGMKDDIFDMCEYVEMRAKRIPKFDKYADTKKIPIQELLDDCWWFGCDICGTDHLDIDSVHNGEAFIVTEKDTLYTPAKFVDGVLICAKCKRRLEENESKQN